MIHANDERLQRLLMGQERLLQEVHGILEEEQRKDDLLRAVVRSTTRTGVNRIARLDPDRIFHVDTIRRLCIRYRLRFLDARRYKGDLPPRALYELRRLEARASAPLCGFKVMAPARRFQLCDSDADPLLFVPVGRHHYYLVHKWGRDLGPLRAVAAWPLRGWPQLAAVVFVLAALAAALLPTSVLTNVPDAGWWGLHRLLALLWTTMVAASFTVFGWFAFFGQFSQDAWNSRHFN